METNLTRRRFLESSAALVGVALVGCGSEGEAKAPLALAVLNGTFRLSGVGKIEPGSAVPFNFPNGEPGLIFTTADGKTGALSAKCTHAGCTVEWSGETKVPLRCPCHESEFGLSGQVISGPAKAPLTRYVVTATGDALLLRKI